MKNSGFDLLEDRILNSGNDNYIEEYTALENLASEKSLRYDYGEILKYALAISELMNYQGNGDKYLHVGGYATLFHIVDMLGFEGIRNWRGSHDLDIISSDYGMEQILSGFFNTESYDSSSIRNKKKVDVKDPKANNPVQIDLYVPQDGIVNIDGGEIPEEMINKAKPINLMGVDVNIPKAHHLLRMKLGIECGEESLLPRSQDMSDALNLMGKIERDKGIRSKYPSENDVTEYVVNKLSKYNPELPSRLSSVITYHKQFQVDNVICPPSKDFTTSYQEKIEARY